MFDMGVVRQVTRGDSDW